MQNAFRQALGEIWIRIGESLLAYAQIYFSRNRATGALFAAATFVVPRHGLSGLFGLVTANLWAHLLRRPKAHIEEGYYGFNGLLSGLAFGMYYRFSVEFLLLFTVISLLLTVIAAALRALMEKYTGLPVLSWPFVITTWTALLAATRFNAVEFTVEPTDATSLLAFVFPTIINDFLRSMGAAFFQLSPLSGLLVFFGVLFFSRWAAWLSIVGYAAGVSVYVVLGGKQSDIAVDLAGFNFILTAIALGGIFVVPSISAILFATGAAAAAAILSAASISFLSAFNLPIVAFPFLVITQVFLFAVYTRVSKGFLKAVTWIPESPEKNLDREMFRNRRYPNPLTPSVFLPVLGRWVITQGHGGAYTHQGLWHCGLDFEVMDDQGKTFREAGMQNRDYYAFGAPAVAPETGKVVRVVAHLPDNPVGRIDTVNNFGNLVLLHHIGNYYSALCHLQQGSISVKEGDAVIRGQILGRVGSSGRSPVPHLHFQLQASPAVGAPAIYGELRHFTSYTPIKNFKNAQTETNRKEYVTQGVPKEGSQVSAPTSDNGAKDTLSILPGRVWEWSFETGGEKHTETWKSEIDAVGNRTITAAYRKSTLSFFEDENYLTMLEYSGPSKSLLSLLYLAVPRVPHTAFEGSTWTDSLSPVSFLSFAARLFHETFLPFGFFFSVDTTTRASKVNEIVTVTTDLKCRGAFLSAKKVPSKIEVDFKSGEGPVRIRAYRNNILFLKGDATY